MNNRSAALIWVFALTLLAAAIRLPMLGHESFWKDELSIWTFVNVPTLGGAIHNGAVLDPHPPLYMLLVYPAVHMINMSEAAFRLPSAILGIACVPLMFLLGRTCFSWREGVISAAFTALLFRPIFYSLEARDYILLCFSSICLGIAWASVCKAIVERKPLGIGALLGYAVLVVLAPFSHYFGVLLAVTMFGHLAWRSFALQSGRKSVALLALFTALMYAPWVPIAKQSYSAFGRSKDSWIPKPGLDAPAVYLGAFYGKFFVVIGLMSLLALAYLVLALKKPSQAEEQNQPQAPFDREMAIELAVWLIAPFVITLIVSVLWTSVFMNRYFLICLPAGYLCTARGITLLTRKQPAWTPLAATGAIIALAWFHMVAMDKIFTRPEKSEYRQAVVYVSKHLAPDAPRPMPVLSTQPMLTYYTDRDGTGLRLVAADHIDSPLPPTSVYLGQNHPTEFWYLDAEDDFKLTGPETFQPDGYRIAGSKRFKDIIAIRFVRD